MNPLEAAVLAILVAMPFHLLLQRAVARLMDPLYLRTQGIVICSEAVVEPGEVVGSYRGKPIYGSLVFMGMHYRFDRVTLPALRERTQAGELYLEPGLIYVAD